MEHENVRRANGFLSVILSILLFLFSCVFIILLVLRFENAAVIIRNTDILEILDDTEISYYIVHQLNGLPFNDSELDFSDVEEFIRSDAVSNEIGDVVDRYARALARGDFDYHLTTDDILDISKNLEPELQDLFDHHMTEADHEHFARTLDDIVDFEGFSVGGVIDEIGIDGAIPFISVSHYLLWGVGILCVVLLLLIFLHHRGRFADAFKNAGIPIMLSGFVFLAVWLVFDVYPQMFGDTVYNLARFTGGLTYLIMRYGITLAVAGILSITISIVLKRRTM
jgi:hypothetical protein